MKTSLALLFFAALLYATPRWIFPVCGSTTMACHRTLIAESWLALALLAIAFIRCALRPVTHLLLPIAILVLLFPLCITGVCPGPHAACHLATRPALITLGVLLLAFYLIVFLADARRAALARRNGIRLPARGQP
jgi:hypothetical protein